MGEPGTSRGLAAASGFGPRGQQAIMEGAPGASARRMGRGQPPASGRGGRRHRTVDRTGGNHRCAMALRGPRRGAEFSGSDAFVRTGNAYNGEPVFAMESMRAGISPAGTGMLNSRPWTSLQPRSIT